MQPAAQSPPSHTLSTVLHVPLHGVQSRQLRLPPPQLSAPVPGWHCEPVSQQPPGQLHGHSHTPLVQSWSVSQRTHGLAPVPHAAG
jgi:hypothetical protein